MISRPITIIIFLYSLVFIITAQTQTSSITIKVTNQFNEAIVGAEIKIFKAEKLKKQAKTNGQGAAIFSNLVEGVYKISISFEGFKDYKSESIIIKLDESKTIVAILEIIPIESKVEINSEDADMDNFGTTRILDQTIIDRLPDDPEGMERVLRQIAGQSVTGEDLPISINGFSGGNLPPKEAIRVIRINQNIFSAEYEGPYGGGIEIFTKSDIEKFNGGIGFSFADSRLNTANPFIFQKLSLQHRRYNLLLSGPIIKKKVSFIFSARHTENDSSTAINAIKLNSYLQPTEYKDIFSNPTQTDNLQFSVNAEATKKHQVYFNFEAENQSSKNRGVGNFSLPSRAYESESRNYILQLSDTYFINENIVNISRFQLRNSKNNDFSNNNNATINVLDAFSDGGSQIDNLIKDWRFEFSNDTTWQMGGYGLAFGFKIRGQEIRRVSKSNFGGTFTFAGRTAPILDTNNNPLLDDNGTILMSQISSLDVYRRTILFQQLGYSNDQIRELGGGASQLTISGGNPNLSANQYDFSSYIQNSYKIRNGLAISFGLRYENQTNINSNLNFSPRFGVMWSPKVGKDKNPLFALPRISTGFGMFYSRFGISNLINQKQTVGERTQFFITDANILDSFPLIPNVDSLNQFALPQISRIINNEIQTPLLKLFSINVVKKLLTDFSISLTYSQTNTSRQAITRNINAPIAGTYNPLEPNNAVYPINNDSGFIYETSSIGKNKLEVYSFRLNTPQTKYLKPNISYSFIKSKSNVVSGSGSSFNPYDFSQEYGSDSRDGKHNFYFVLSSNLPYGLEVSNDFYITSGERFNIITGHDTNGDGFFTERPSFASDLTKQNLIYTKYGVLDPNPSPIDKIIPRNLGRGSTIVGYDMRISKNFKIGNGKDSQGKRKYGIGISIFIRNMLNIVNEGTPIGNMSSPNFLNPISYATEITNHNSSNGMDSSGFSGRSFYFSTGFRF